jgi:AraC-like DNA-binding protein
LQRQVVEHLLSSSAPDRLFVEESLLKVLDRTLVAAFGHPVQPEAEKRSHREVVNHLKELLAARFAGPLTLDGLAAELHYSPYHLCRLFQRSTGTTIHQYLNRLRLRTALEWMSAGRDLGEVAIHLGYSSHSHFSAAFRKEFGASPSAIRASF